MTDAAANPYGIGRRDRIRGGADEVEGIYPPREADLAEPVPEDVQEGQKERLRAVWAQPKGWRYWTAVNNSEVGVWYCLTAFFFMLAAGVLALLMRVQLAVPGNDFLSRPTATTSSTRCTARR